MHILKTKKNSCKILNNNFRLKTFQLRWKLDDIYKRSEQCISRYLQCPLKTVQHETRGYPNSTKVQVPVPNYDIGSHHRLARQKANHASDFKQGQLNNNRAGLALENTQEYWLIKISWEHLNNAPALIHHPQKNPKKRLETWSLRERTGAASGNSSELGLLFVTTILDNILLFFLLKSQEITIRINPI